MKLFKTMLYFVLAAVLVGSFATNVAGQSAVSGAISGSVVDQTGSAVPGATLTLTNRGTGSALTAVTDNSGAYTFPIVGPGEYTLSVEKQNFRKIEKPVTAVVGQNLANNFKLEVGNVSETIQVEAAPPLLQVENANLSTTFETRQVENVPNGGQDMTMVAQTAPGVLMNTSSGGGYGNFTAFGLPATANLFTINGNDANDPYLNLNNSGATNLMLGTNEVQEAAVISNGYTVQYGRQAGAQVDYATKSGTNQFHGNAVYWYNSGGMNANDFFNNATNTPLPHEVNNQWAASIGGPIKKDKVFFFVDQEGLRYVLGTSNQETLPTPAFQQAVISNMLAGNSGVTAASIPFYQNMFNLMNGAPGLNRAKPVNDSIDSTNNLGCGDLNTTDGSGSVVPGFAQFGGMNGTTNSVYGTNLGGGTPCAQFYRSTVGAVSPEWTLAAKADVIFREADRVSIRYRMDRGTQATYTDPISPVFNATSVQPEYDGQINWTHILGPTKTNQLILSGLWYSAIFGPESTAAQKTFPGALYNFDTSGWGSASTLVLLGGENNVFPQGRNVSQIQIVDDFSWTKGNHTLKFGGNFRYNKISDHSNSVRVVPRMRIFSTTDFVEGFLDQISQRFPNLTSTSAGIYSLGLYFMDEWRVNANLKLTLGIRADRNSNAVCYQDCYSRLYTTFPDVNHDNSIPFNQLFVNNLSHAFPDLQSVAWEPRVGFAWTPNSKFTKPGTTVIRGGVGLFSDLYPGTLIDSYMHNAMALRQFTISTAPPFSPAEPANAYVSESTCDNIFTSTVAAGGNRAQFLSAATAANLPCTPPDYNSVANKVYNPIYIEWNLQLQQSLAPRTVVSFNYVGNHGYQEFTNNPYANSSAPLPNTVNTACTGAPQSMLNTCTPFVGLPLTRPDRRVNNVFNLTNSGISNYNGLSVSLTQRVTKGFSGTINYTFSHTQDMVSNGGTGEPYSFNDSLVNLANPVCLSCNYANSDYDTRHNISASYVWQLPFKFSNKMMETVAGGWQVSGAIFWRTGLPFSVTDGLVPGQANSILNSVNGIFLASPSGSALTLDCGSAAANTYSANSSPCLNSGQFLPSRGESSFSTLSRNKFRGPGYFNSDFSVLKNFHLNERMTFALGANFYNVFNHPNFGNPIGDITNGQFGQIVNTDIPPTSPYGAFTGSAVSGREIQVTGRFTF
jgi:hypothetical protein